MENRQRTIRKLLWRITAVLAVLAVVSICFVSGTFARYVSNRSGSTVTEVAKWDIDFTTKDGELKTSTFALVNKLSPSKNAFTVGSDGTVTNRKKSSGTVLVLMIENKGDVDATLTITPPEKNSLIFYGYAENGTDAAATAYEGWREEGFAIGGDGTITAPSLDEAQAVITMEFALTTKEITADNESKFESEWKPLSGLNLDKLILKAPKQGSGAGGTTGDDTSTGEETQAGDETQTTETSVYYFYVRSKWTSRDQHYYDTYKGDLKTAAEMSDGLDTWLGENIAKLGGEFTFAAIQASEWPAEDNTP